MPALCPVAVMTHRSEARVHNIGAQDRESFVLERVDEDFFEER